MIAAKTSIVPFTSRSTRLRDDVSESATAAVIADFSDPESQRVLAAAACSVAHELGRAAAREWFAESIGKPKDPR